jgi:5'-nucleotidase
MNEINIFVLANDSCMKEGKKTLEILVTNDDGIHAKGLHELIEVAREFGNVTVAAPADGNSGMSHAITVKFPLRAEKVKEESGFTMYQCWGTPVDCIKLAFNRFLKVKPDILLSGINHGSNSSTSIFYSGTMAAAIEGKLYGVPSIGFSLLDYNYDADFTSAKTYARKIIAGIAHKQSLNGICLNVNIPALDENKIKGIKICRQTMGHWIEEFEHRKDPQGRDYYWLTGEFLNKEPEANDTDEWALKNNYVAVVPVQLDFTCYNSKTELEKIKFY